MSIRACESPKDGVGWVVEAFRNDSPIRLDLGSRNHLWQVRLRDENSADRPD